MLPANPLRSIVRRCALVALLGHGLVALPSCKTGPADTLKQMGAWVGSDAKAFGSDIVGAPQYFSSTVTRQAGDFSGSVSWMAEEVARNSRTTADNITGAPAWIANQTSSNLKDMRESAGGIASWVADDAHTFMRDDVYGAPAYIAGKVSEQSKDLASGFGILFDWIASDFANFWKNVGETFEIMIVR
jgi:hypothetical protein